MRFSLLLIVLAIILAAAAVDDWKLLGVAKTEPQSLTLEKLEAEGYGENAHLSLEDFFLCQNDYVVLEKKGKWVEAYVPAVSLEGEFYKTILAAVQDDDLDAFYAPSSFPVLVTLDVDNEDELMEMADRDVLTGMITNKIGGIGGKTRSILEESYPDTDFDTVLLFEVGRKPSTMTSIFLRLLLAVGLGLWFCKRVYAAFKRPKEIPVST